MVDDMESDDTPAFAAKQAAAYRRKLERIWARLVPIETCVSLRWLDGEPTGRQEADAEVVINGRIDRVTVGETRKTIDGEVFDPEVRRYGYRGAVERWALWKWHTARGTPLNERGEKYELEPGFAGPSYEWTEPDAIKVEGTLTLPKRRGRPPKVAQAA